MEDEYEIENHRERYHELSKVQWWAQRLLSNPDTLILDTETTGLDGYLVEIGVIRLDGSTAFHSLVNPRVPIEDGAFSVHGISAKDVKKAPTFADLEPQLRELLWSPTWMDDKTPNKPHMERGNRPVVIYNAAFDMGILHNELERLFTEAWHPEQEWLKCDLPSPGDPRWSELSIADMGKSFVRNSASRLASKGWLGKVQPRCAMEQYAVWVGDWNNYRSSYRWQRLNGGHRALDDCRACLALIHKMAQPLPEDEIHKSPREIALEKQVEILTGGLTSALEAVQDLTQEHGISGNAGARLSDAEHALQEANPDAHFRYRYGANAK